MLLAFANKEGGVASELAMRVLTRGKTLEVREEVGGRSLCAKMRGNVSRNANSGASHSKRERTRAETDVNARRPLAIVKKNCDFHPHKFEIFFFFIISIDES